MKKYYYTTMKVLIAIVMVLAFIEQLYFVSLLMAFILLMFIRKLRNWITTPDEV